MAVIGARRGDVVVVWPDGVLVPALLEVVGLPIDVEVVGTVDVVTGTVWVVVGKIVTVVPVDVVVSVGVEPVEGLLTVLEEVTVTGAVVVMIRS